MFHNIDFCIIALQISNLNVYFINILKKRSYQKTYKNSVFFKYKCYSYFFQKKIFVTSRIFIETDFKALL